MSRSRHKSKCGRSCGVCWYGPSNQARLHRIKAEQVERAEMVVDGLDELDEACWAVAWECLCQGCEWCDPTRLDWVEWQGAQA